ncbi:MAG TPA: hypothetical protein VF549_17840 [Solirubrobacteraceae bacterium]
MSRTLPPAARPLAAVVLLAGTAALTRASSWRKPLGTDTGQYLYIGDLVLHGGTPYTDAVTNKGPLTYLLFAVIRLGAGTSMTAVRLALLAFAVVAAVALGAYVAHFAGRAAGALAAVAFALFAGLPALQGADPNTEQFGIALIVGSWWLATQSARGAGWSLAAGASIAAAVAMNPAFGLALPFVAFEVVRASRRRADLPPPRRSGPEGGARCPSGRWDGRTSARRVALATAGGLAVALPLLVWLLASGALDDMWHQVVDYALNRADGSVTEGAVPDDGTSTGSDGEGTLGLPARGLWLLGVLGLLVACTEARLRRVALPLLAWVVVCWARVKVATYEFPHHYYPVVPALAAGLALGGLRFAELVPRPRVRWALAAVVLAIPLWQWVAVPERDALDVPPGLRWGKEFRSFSLAYPVASFVRAHTREDDRILVAGTDAEVYWLADRHASSPYFDVFPILADGRRAGQRANDVAYDPPAAIVAMPGAEDADPFFVDLLALHEFPPAYEVDGARVWLLKR